MEISLGIVVADVSYQPGDICDNRGNCILCVQGMDTLGTDALVHTLMTSLNGCVEGCVDLPLLTRQWCGGCSAGIGYGRQTRCLDGC